MSSLSASPFFVKNGMLITVMAASVSDPDRQNLTLVCDPDTEDPYIESAKCVGAQVPYSETWSSYSDPTCSFSSSFTDNGRKNITCKLYDGVWYSSISKTPVLTDNIAPVTEFTTPASGSWQKSDFNITFISTDPGDMSNSSGINSSLCKYKVMSNGVERVSWSPITCTTVKMPATAGEGRSCNAEGTNACVIYLNATDVSGNTRQTPFSVSVDWTKPIIELSHSPAVIGEWTWVTIDASVSDLSGAQNITIIHDNVPDVCASSPCYYTTPSLLSGEHNYSAIAYDNAGNYNITQTKSFTVCRLNSVSISPLCSACKKGDKIRVSADYSGDCPSVGFVQVDASSLDGKCGVQKAINSTLLGFVQGINVSCTSGVCSDWVIPSVDFNCQGRAIAAKEASLKQDPNSNEFLSIKEAAGSFDFAFDAENIEFPITLTLSDYEPDFRDTINATVSCKFIFKLTEPDTEINCTENDADFNITVRVHEKPIPRSEYNWDNTNKKWAVPINTYTYRSIVTAEVSYRNFMNFNRTNYMINLPPEIPPDNITEPPPEIPPGTVVITPDIPPVIVPVGGQLNLTVHLNDTNGISTVLVCDANGANANGCIKQPPLCTMNKISGSYYDGWWLCAITAGGIETNTEYCIFFNDSLGVWDALCSPYS